MEGVGGSEMVESLFGVQKSGSTVGREILAGLTTFMVMAYIIFVNPAILSFSGLKDFQGLGPGFAPTLAVTCLVAGVMTILMGVIANYPLAIASGMGLNAVVAFQLIVSLKLAWPAAMGVIFTEGLIITILVLTGFREAVMNAIPVSLKQAISVGIGLFILFIGLVSGALLIGIVLTTLVAIAFNAMSGYKTFTTPGMAVIPAQLVSWPDFSTFGKGLNFQVFSHLGVLTAALTIFSIMLADFFDTMGTVIGIGGKAGWLDSKGNLPRLNRVLLIDSLGAAFGGIASASSATTYIESAAGVSEGGKTGLASVVTGVLFLLALFFSPLAAVVPPQATAPALILVGFLMCAIVREIQFDDFEEGFPALMTMVIMPFTYSITNGIGAGFVTYTFIKLARGKGRDVHWVMYLVSLAFLVYFAMGWVQGLLAS